MQSDAATVDDYLGELPDDRREAIEAVRRVILDHLPEGYEEQMQFGMISYVVPLERYPDTYNGQALAIASLASQKRHMAVYLMGIYGKPEEEAWFRKRYEATGKRMDMGRSCVRFRRLDDLPLDLVGEAVERVPVDDFLEFYETSRQRQRTARQRQRKD